MGSFLAQDGSALWGLEPFRGAILNNINTSALLLHKVSKVVCAASVKQFKQRIKKD